MIVQFSPPLADSRNYPVPDILVSPKVAEKAPFSSRNNVMAPHTVKLVNRARTAIFIIAKSMGGERVWVPAYHCPALVEPFVAVNIEVLFYPLDEELKPDMEFLAANIRQHDTVVGIHYFGFSVGIRELAELVKGKKGTFIEDKAHAAFNNEMHGDSAVTSLVKFYPVQEGAELIISAGAEQQEIIRQYERLPSLITRKISKLCGKIVGKVSSLTGQRGKPSSFRYFNTSDLCRELSTRDKTILDHSAHTEIAKKRRENFTYLSDRLKDVALGRLLYADLDMATVPYVLPFLLNDGGGFDQIRKQGLQVFRWEELADTKCKISASYRERLVQIPVHQDLNKEQLDKIVGIIESAGEAT